MDDYDWLSESQSGWTHHSTHPDSDVNYANEFDLNLKGWIFQDANYKAGVVAGYQETRFSWTALGGAYDYNNGASVGNFPAGERGIGYSQRFTMPYVGLAGQYRIDNFEFNALLKFSDWVRAMITMSTICATSPSEIKPVIHAITARHLMQATTSRHMRKCLLSSLTANIKRAKAGRRLLILPTTDRNSSVAMLRVLPTKTTPSLPACNIAFKPAI